MADKKNKVTKRKITVKDSMKELNVSIDKAKENIKKTMITGKKLNKKTLFNTHYKNSIEIAQSEEFFWRPEDYIIRMLGEGLPYSLNRIIKFLKTKIIDPQQRGLISKRKVMSFLGELEDININKTPFQLTISIDDRAIKKLKKILFEKDEKREKVTKHITKKLKAKNSKKILDEVATGLDKTKKIVPLYDKKKTEH